MTDGGVSASSAGAVEARRSARAAALRRDRIAIEVPDETVIAAIERAKLELDRMLDGFAAAGESVARHDARWRANAALVGLAALAAGDPGGAGRVIDLLHTRLQPAERVLAEAERDDALFALLLAQYDAWTGEADPRHPPSGRTAILIALGEDPDSPVEDSFRRWRTEAESDVAAARTLAVLVHGILGVEPDAARNRVSLHPRLPSAWDRLHARNVILGDAALDFRYNREGDRHTLRIEQTRGGLPLRVALHLDVPGRALAGAMVDGAAADLKSESAGGRVVVPVQLILDRPHELETAVL